MTRWHRSLNSLSCHMLLNACTPLFVRVPCAILRSKSLSTEPKIDYIKRHRRTRVATSKMLIILFQALSQIPVHIYTTAGLITQVSWSRIHGSELVVPQLRPSASPCGRWCRHRPRAVPIHCGFSHRCCIAPRIRQPSAVSLTAAMGSCLWGNQIPQSGSQLQIHKGIWNVIQLKFIWAPPSSKRRNVKIRTQITKQ